MKNRPGGGGRGVKTVGAVTYDELAELGVTYDDCERLGITYDDMESGEARTKILKDRECSPEKESTPAV